jgi:hypothetical protein
MGPEYQALSRTVRCEQLRTRAQNQPRRRNAIMGQIASEDARDAFG